MAAAQTILIVEDSSTQALKLQMLLEKEGLKVLVAGTGEEAIEIFNHTIPNLVILDYYLPGIQGDELCRQIRMNINTRGIPILMLTAEEENKSEVRSLESGADDYILKSSDPDILMIKIRTLLRKFHLSSSILEKVDSYFRRARILAVDDSPTYLEFIFEELVKEGYTVSKVSSAKDGLNLLIQSNYDCALIDLVMPDMDGIEMCRRVNEMRQNMDNPIVVLMLTARETKEDLTRALEAGADDFVGKTSDMAVLKGRIRALLRRKFFQEENRRIIEELKSKELEAVSARADKAAAETKVMRQSEERFRALTENNLDGIAVIGAQGESLYVSPALPRILGTTEEDLAGRILKELAHPDDAAYFEAKLLEAIQNPGKIIQARYRLKHKDGSWRSADVTATNLIHNPAIGGIVLNIRDVTEKLKIEEIARIGEAQAIEKLKDYAIFMLDPHGKVLTWNAGAEHLKGYKASEIIGKHFSMFFTSEDKADQNPQKLLETAAQEGRVEIKGWRVRKDGSRYLADEIITALRNEKEELRGFIKVERDITDRERMSEEIKQSNTFLNTVLENIPNMIFVKDAKELRFVRFNRAGEDLLGFPRESLLGKNDYDFFPKEQADFFTSKDRGVLEGGKLLDIPEEPIETKNMGNRLLHTKKIPILGKDGKPQYLLGISEDITELKQQEELKIYTQALETSNRELQDFVFVASHDLQEPLRKIQSFGEFLKNEFKEVLGETGRDYVERMRSAANRMQTLINDLLALTRVTTKAQPFLPVDLSEVLRGVLSDMEMRVKEKNAKVEVEKLHTLQADATQMRQLFQNLIGNALKFQKPGVPPVVKVSATVLEGGQLPSGRCRIKVEDNGIGFDNKYGEQIFKVFERLHGRDEYEGTGIGLAICRKVVERHGGTIRAEGVPGKGSTFIVELPIQPKA